MELIGFKEVSGQSTAYCLAEVYLEDIVRAELSKAKLRENLYWQEWSIKTGLSPPVFHVGRILNKKVLEYGGPNTIVANGKNLNAQRLFAAGGPPTQINTMAVGTDNTASSSSQAQLNPSVAGSTFFQAFDSTPSVAAGVATCICTLGTGVANFSHAEIGMFNGTVNGTSVMLDRIAPIGPFTKSSANSIIYTITYTQG